MAKATELGIRIYRDSNAGCFDPSLETYRAMVKTGEVPLSYSKESLIEALTLEYQQTPTNAKRNVLSKLRGYSQPINNERQALAFYNTIVASVKSSSAGVYLTALKQVSPLFKNIKRPRYQKPDVEPLSLDQLKAILEAVSGSHYGPLFNLLALTGARPSELLGLRWGKVFLDEGYILIDSQLTKDKKIGPTKNRKSRRVFLSPKASELFRNLKPQKVDPDALVFTNTKGQPISLIGLREVWHKRLKNAGLPRTKLYKLRSTRLSQLLENGYSLAQVANQGGHSINTLITNYAGVVSQIVMKDYF
ncbi:tyrosine-type recombinase/integrase [Gloeothece verrucosa]|nr:site-specific integrase [Gloeothece verrucosa]